MLTVYLKQMLTMYIRIKFIRYIPKMCIEKQWGPEIKQKKINEKRECMYLRIF